MAKKKKIDFDKYAAGLFTRTEQYADKVRQHYATAVNELLKLTATGDLGASGAFSFGDNTTVPSAERPPTRTAWGRWPARRNR